jgi:hypothetical protein
LKPVLAGFVLDFYSFVTLSGFNSIIIHLVTLTPPVSSRLCRDGLKLLSSSKARLYLRAPAWPGADKTTYADIGTAQGMEAVTKNAKSLGLGNFGGVMFWDGPEGMLNQDGGKDIIAWAKAGLLT